MATSEHANGAGSSAEELLFEELLFSESVPEGLERSGNGLLSLKDIQIRLDTDYSRLTRLANAPGIAEWVGAVTTSKKGVRYEPYALEVFRRLVAASDAKDLTPGTAVAWLRNNQNSQPSESPETGITEKPKSGNSLAPNHIPAPSHSADLATRGLMAVLAPVVNIMQEVRDLLHDFRSGKAQIAPPSSPMPDRLLTAEEAAALLACSPRSVNRHVKEVLPRKWKESDVLRYIQQLEPKVR